MKVLNIHQRIIAAPVDKLGALLSEVELHDNPVWPKNKWPAIKLDNGLNPGSKGKHGPIEYTVTAYTLNKLIEFRFRRPKGFNGIHKFEISEAAANKSQLKHTIDINTTGTGTLKWIVGIKWLHNALIEDLLDNVENALCATNKSSRWSPWVRFLRGLLKRKK